MTYCVIIGDIKSSKNLENRSFVQDKLNGALAQLNKSYKTDIAADFLITLGDEFQGVLTNSSVAMDIIQYIQRVMYPVELRFGVGFGDIVTKINRNAAIGADGPVFWAARNAINTIHEDETYYKKQAQDVMVAIYQSNNRRIHEINTMLAMLKAIENNWSQGVRATVWDMMTYHGTQIECAKRLSLNKATVTKRLTEGNYYIYLKAIDTIKNAMTLLMEELDG